MSNNGLQSHYARLTLDHMDALGVDEYWIGHDLISRFECERLLGVGEEGSAPRT